MYLNIVIEWNLCKYVYNVRINILVGCFTKKWDTLIETDKSEKMEHSLKWRDHIIIW